MIYTEKEAAEKWCPHVRYANDSGTLWSNRADNNGFNGCVGMRCMAWRVAYRSKDDPNAVVAHYRPSNEPHWIEVGYCGLAGKVTPR